MSSVIIFRLAARIRSQKLFRPHQAGRQLPVLTAALPVSLGCSCFSTSVLRAADKDGQEAADHHEESFEEFTARYEKEFDAVQDVFELQRNLNNAFAYDLVPSPSVITAALKAARRVNDYPTAVRIFEGIKAKVENKAQYEEYLVDLKPLRDELGVNLKEDLYPDPLYSGSTEAQAS
ncbi:MAG: Cytochrome c oxidase subunit mitochondrial [Lasallia pustulata]|uniref:Cytochrome c oxidase subunit 6, mitochondrial n=1 Tax=Lasallia pustulata TaxID=136370 RepID=A0A5M8PHA1_9LECA|nr:MAG: Cytochrome c oxidase subunit mitochondrial [Lasallia pustulata]